MKSRAEKLHDRKVCDLEASLLSSGEIDSCDRFLPYQFFDCEGEIDILGYKDNRMIFYEVKLHYHQRRLNKARYQYEHFLHAFGLNKEQCRGYAILGNRRVDL